MCLLFEYNNSMSLSNRLIAKDDFSARYIFAGSRLRATLEILHQNYDFDMPDELPLVNHTTKDEISVDIQTVNGHKICVRVPYSGSPVIEISSDKLIFDIEAYRKRVAKFFRCG